MFTATVKNVCSLHGLSFCPLGGDGADRLLDPATRIHDPGSDSAGSSGRIRRAPHRTTWGITSRTLWSWPPRTVSTFQIPSVSHVLSSMFTIYRIPLLYNTSYFQVDIMEKYFILWWYYSTSIAQRLLSLWQTFSPKGAFCLLYTLLVMGMFQLFLARAS